MKNKLVLVAIIAISSLGKAEELRAKPEAIETTKAEFLEQEQRQRVILSNLYQINRRIKELSENRNKTTDKILNMQSHARDTANSVSELEQRIENQRQELARSLKTLYLMGGENILRLIFSATSLHDLEKRTKYLKLFADRDYSIIKNYEVTLAQIKAKRSQLKKELEQLIALRGQAIKQEKVLVVEQEQKVRVLDRLRRESSANLKKLQELNGGEDLLATSIFERKGKLSPPVAGVVSQAFGYIHHQEYRYKLAHKGLFIISDIGHEVRAIFNGKVAFAQVLPGYGKSIIIDHGDNYYSFYSYNSKLKVKSGDVIKEGDIIAVSGHKPNGESGIYFEIRHFSDAIDPQPWLKEWDGFKQSLLF